MKRGDEAMNSKNWNEAAAYFEYVKTKFPFLDAAKTAELRLADADYERERFAEARERYQNFVRLHPTHPQVDYAAYRAALTHYREVPSDFFVLPPSSEKDQVEVRNALTAMTEFTRTYAGSSLSSEALKVVADVKRRLADHEMYVAEFYAKRNRWGAVVTRLGVVAKNYSGIGLDEQVAFGRFEAYQKLGKDASAKAALEEYVARFPEDDGAKRARKILTTSSAAPDAGT